MVFLANKKPTTKPKKKTTVAKKTTKAITPIKKKTTTTKKTTKATTLTGKGKDKAIIKTPRRNNHSILNI